MTQTLALPPPYHGQNDKLPLAALQNPFAEDFLNFSNKTGIPELRQGDNRFFGQTIAFAHRVKHLATYGRGTSQKLFQFIQDGAFNDISTGAIVSTYAAGGLSNGITTLEFNKYLFAFSEGATSGTGFAVTAYNGTAWGLAGSAAWLPGWTFPSGFYGYGGEAHKNRAYIIGFQSATYCYGPIDGVSGTMTKVDLSSLLSSRANLISIKSISLSQGIAQENVLAFLFDNGEILVYGGSYPDTSDWGLIGRFIIPTILSYNCIISARGDAFIITKAGLISLRTLFTQGTDVALAHPLSENISSTWRAIFGGTAYDTSATLDSYNLCGVYDSKNDWLIISIPNNRGASGPSRLIYSFPNSAWFTHVTWSPEGYPSTSIVEFQNSIYYGINEYFAVMKMGGSSNFQDADPKDGSLNSFIFQLTTAPIPLSKYGVNSIQGAELLIETDWYDHLDFQFVANLGQSQTVKQKIQDQGSGVARPFSDMGIDGSYVQLKLSGSTAASNRSVGIKVNGFNVWFDPGGKGSR